MTKTYEWLPLNKFLEDIKEDNSVEITPQYIDTIKGQLKKFYGIDSQEYIEETKREPVLVLRDSQGKQLLKFLWGFCW